MPQREQAEFLSKRVRKNPNVFNTYVNVQLASLHTIASSWAKEVLMYTNLAYTDFGKPIFTISAKKPAEI